MAHIIVGARFFLSSARTVHLFPLVHIRLAGARSFLTFARDVHRLIVCLSELTAVTSRGLDNNKGREIKVQLCESQFTTDYLELTAASYNLIYTLKCREKSAEESYEEFF